MKKLKSALLAVLWITTAVAIAPARAEIDGHGPDAWRVTSVSPHDVLNARMGPGTNYPIIETFAHNERGMQQITCVPFYTLAHYERFTQAQIDALPQRWCLMRNAAMTKAGWVAQRFITPDDLAASGPERGPVEVFSTKPSGAAGYSSSGDAIVDEAERLVRSLYDAQALAEQGRGADMLQGGLAAKYFTSDMVALMRSGVGAHPLYGGQDFEGYVTRIAPDPDLPMLRGMITINVDFTNFGQPQRAAFYLRADTTQPGAPLRIFRIEHDGWSIP